MRKTQGALTFSCTAIFMGKERTVNTNINGSVPLPEKISFLSYRDEDYEAVCDFLIELNRKDRTHINWNRAQKVQNDTKMNIHPPSGWMFIL